MTTTPTKPHDYTAALLIAGRIITNALGQTVPEPRLRSELRAMQPDEPCRAGQSPLLDDAQKARVRELKAEGKTFADIARIIGTSYHRVYQVNI
jgi:hypothetical protein